MLFTNTNIKEFLHASCKNIHFIGIGGAGMCAIAEILLTDGYQISGSDVCANNNTHRLSALGAKIYTQHHADNVANAHMIVFSSAIRQNNVELEQARKRKLPIFHRGDILAQLMRYKFGITVIGSHGKTTTTSLLAAIFTAANYDPTYIIGGTMLQNATNAKLGQSEYLLAEADESDASFRKLNPIINIMTNLSCDHMDTYQCDLTRLQQNFIDFANSVPHFGSNIICADNPMLTEISQQINTNKITYGWSSDAQIKASNYQQQKNCSFFTLHASRFNIDNVNLRVNLPGKHNIQNALAAISVALQQGIDITTIQQSLANFAGVERRFCYHENIIFANKKINIISDYGHHPYEISANINTIKNGWSQYKLWIIFQPHRYTRTRDLFEEFVTVLNSLENLILLPIYSAYEEEISGISSISLLEKIKLNNSNAIYLESEKLLPFLATKIQENDLLLFQGAGNIDSIFTMLVDNTYS